jgi:hypothetical protein
MTRSTRNHYQAIVDTEYTPMGLRLDTLACGHKVVPPRRGSDGYVSASKRRCYVCAGREGTNG